MWAYEVVSEADSVPPITNLGQPLVQGPSASGHVSHLTFPTDFKPGEIIRYEPAVGCGAKLFATKTVNARSAEVPSIASSRCA